MVTWDLRNAVCLHLVLTLTNVLSRLHAHTAACIGLNSNTTTTTTDHTFISLRSLLLPPANTRSLQLCGCIPSRSDELRLDISIQLCATTPSDCCDCSNSSGGVGVYPKACDIGDSDAQRNDVYATEGSDFLFLYAELCEGERTLVKRGWWSWREEAV